MPATNDWLESDRLKEEFGAIGFYLSAHPLDSYVKALERLKVCSYAKLERNGMSGPVKMAGMIISKRERVSAKGNKYAFVQLSDSSGSYEITVFSEVLATSNMLLVPGSKVIVNCSVDSKNQLKLLANRIVSLDEATAKSSAGLKIYSNNITALRDIKEVLANEGMGNGTVSLVSTIDMQEITTELPGNFPSSPAMAQALKAITGVDDVREV